MMKFEKSWSIGNAVTLIVIVASIFTQYGISSQEVVVIKKDIEVQSVDIKQNTAKIVKLEKDNISLEKDIESIKNTNERMETKINKILSALTVIDYWISVLYYLNMVLQSLLSAVSFLLLLGLLSGSLLTILLISTHSSANSLERLQKLKKKL